VAAQQQIEQLQREQSSTAAAVADSRSAADKAQAELAALRARVGDVEKINETQSSSVAELTELNDKLEQERDALKQQLAAAQTETARLTALQRNADQLRTDAERSAAQNIDALTAQLAQLRREVDGLRASNQSLSDSNRTLDRERQIAVAQLRQENSALAARLAQAQGTLDQIAAAARLGTPAAGIASTAQPVGNFLGANVTPSSPVPTAEPRVHVVADGDSLSRLSLRYYGTASRWQEIYNANRDVLQGANALRVGQRLRIP
jgi:nucleoid-associated protein YgaU